MKKFLAALFAVFQINAELSPRGNPQTNSSICTLEITEAFAELGFAAYIIGSHLSGNIFTEDQNVPVCTYLIINSDSYIPVNDFPPDSFVINAIGRNYAQSIVSLSSQLKYDTFILSRDKQLRIYTIPLKLRDADLYDIKVVLECTSSLISKRLDMHGLEMKRM